MEARFYLANVTHPKLDGSTVEEKGVLYFYMKKNVLGDAKAAPFEFDGRANREHVAGYPREFNSFQKAHPSFVLPWDKEQVKAVFGQPTHVEVKPEAPVVEIDPPIVGDDSVEDLPAEEAPKPKKGWARKVKN